VTQPVQQQQPVQTKNVTFATNPVTKPTRRPVQLNFNVQSKNLNIPSADELQKLTVTELNNIISSIKLLHPKNVAIYDDFMKKNKQNKSKILLIELLFEMLNNGDGIDQDFVNNFIQRN